MTDKQRNKIIARMKSLMADASPTKAIERLTRAGILDQYGEIDKTKYPYLYQYNQDRQE